MRSDEPLRPPMGRERARARLRRALEVLTWPQPARVPVPRPLPQRDVPRFASLLALLSLLVGLAACVALVLAAAAAGCLPLPASSPVRAKALGALHRACALARPALLSFLRWAAASRPSRHTEPLLRLLEQRTSTGEPGGVVACQNTSPPAARPAVSDWPSSPQLLSTSALLVPPSPSPSERAVSKRMASHSAALAAGEMMVSACLDRPPPTCIDRATQSTEASAVSPRHAAPLVTMPEESNADVSWRRCETELAHAAAVLRSMAAGARRQASAALAAHRAARGDRLVVAGEREKRVAIVHALQAQVSPLASEAGCSRAERCPNLPGVRPPGCRRRPTRVREQVTPPLCTRPPQMASLGVKQGQVEEQLAAVRAQLGSHEQQLSRSSALHALLHSPDGSDYPTSRSAPGSVERPRPSSCDAFSTPRQNRKNGARSFRCASPYRQVPCAGAELDPHASLRCLLPASPLCHCATARSPLTRRRRQHGERLSVVTRRRRAHWRLRRVHLSTPIPILLG